MCSCKSDGCDQNLEEKEVETLVIGREVLWSCGLGLNCVNLFNVDCLSGQIYIKFIINKWSFW